MTDQASLLHETARRPLLDGQSTVWGNRKKGTVTVVYDGFCGRRTPAHAPRYRADLAVRSRPRLGHHAHGR